MIADRHPYESVSQFVAALRQLSEYCDYNATIDEMLRDRLVCGIKEDRIQRRLFAEPGLTFKKAIKVSFAMEMAVKNAHDLQVQELKPVHKVTKRNREMEDCYRCGGQKKDIPKETRNRNKANFVEEDSDEFEETHSLYQVESSAKRKPYIVTVGLNGKDIPMEIDTGASMSLIREKTCEQIFGSNYQLDKSV